jgi:RNA-binding protein
MNDVLALRARAKGLEPILQIGKHGLTEASTRLIDRELADKRLIKIKLLKTALPEGATRADRHALAHRIAQETQSVLVEQVGHVVVLYRE